MFTLYFELVTLLLFQTIIYGHFKLINNWVIHGLIYFFDFNLLQKLVKFYLLVKIYSSTQSLCWKFAKPFSKPKHMILAVFFLSVENGLGPGLEANKTPVKISFSLWFNRMPGYMGFWVKQNHSIIWDQQKTNTMYYLFNYDNGISSLSSCTQIFSLYNTP